MDCRRWFARPFCVALLGAVLGSAALASRAWALSACTAAQVIAQDPGCPSGTGACSITMAFDVGNGCVLDFGSRGVTLTASGTLDIASNTVTLKAGSFTVAAGGFINGKGNDAPPRDRGGSITIETTGAVAVQKAGNLAGRIDVSGASAAGDVRIIAGGAVTLGGELKTNALNSTGAAGLISVDAGGDVTTLPGSTLSGTGGFSSGTIDIEAGGRVELGETIELDGEDGGDLLIEAGADVVVRRLQASSTGDGGDGGFIDIVAGTSVRFVDTVYFRGNPAGDGSYGGDGGFLDVAAGFGDISIETDLFGEGASPDGFGGDVTLTAAGSILVAPLVTFSLRGIGAEGDGGELDADAGLDFVHDGLIDASGGFGGGFIALTARRDVGLDGLIDVTGRSDGGLGGFVLAEAGFQGGGTLTVGGTIDAGGGACATFTGCGEGGNIDLSGCDLTVTASGHVLARAPDGGTNTLVAREQLTVDGEVDATGSVSNGTNPFSHPSSSPPALPGTIAPAPLVTAFATCTSAGQSACLVPCPTCGNGVVEFPETCDSAGPPQSCDGDGCSAFCRLESCTDPNPCTADLCDPLLGCGHPAEPDGTACANGLVCDGAEICRAGLCLPGTPLACGDPNPCTVDGCSEPGGCTSAPAMTGTPCSDNNACTMGDGCDGAGACQPGGMLTCDDGKECTNDSCSTATGCVFTNRTGTCTDDGNECTNDVCGGGLCTHPARTGSCTDDGNACTNDSCSGGVCTHPNKTNGTACNDGTFCTNPDTCQGGLCGGAARSCGDTNACTSDTCDETNQTCVHDPITPCCGNSVPEPGGGEECDDGNTSNTDACVGTCRLARCGDGFLRAGVEQCDLGAANADTPNAGCRLDCRLPRCGDAIVDDQRGEQCDDGAVTSGDGCSSRCFAEPPPTAELIAGKGKVYTDCGTEWAMDRPAHDIRTGLPSFKQTCRDGDPTCDHGATPGECLFEVWLCANNHDPNLPLCRPGTDEGGIGTVTQLELRKPGARDADRRAEDAANRSLLLNAGFAIEGVGFDTCGPRLRLRVPLRTPTSIGNKKVKLRATTALGVIDADQLKLFCTP